MGLEGFDGVFLDRFRFRESLAIVKVDEVGSSIVLASLSAFGAVPSEMSYFSALEARIRCVSRGSCIALEVALWTISLVAVGVLSSSEVIPPVVSSIISLGWGPVPIYVHWDRSVVHPARSV